MLNIETLFKAIYTCYVQYSLWAPPKQMHQPDFSIFHFLHHRVRVVSLFLQAPAVQKLDSAIHLAPVARKVDSAIHRINLYPLDSAISFPNTYPLDSDLSGG